MVGRDETWRYLVVVVGGDSITHLMVHQGLPCDGPCQWSVASGRWAGRAVDGRKKMTHTLQLRSISRRES
jgi:hypothetical protein